MLSCSADKNCAGKGFLTPPATWRTNRHMPVMPGSEKKPRRSPQARTDLFHVIHKVPAGDSPYVRAKHVQLIDKDPSRAISLFWSAINSGDRVDSALKDMAVVMKQLNRSDEAIEAIKSFRHLCPAESQESLDNVLIELYKKSGRIEEEIEMLQLKLKHIEEGIAFGGKQTKMARSQGKKINITIEKEYSRLLGNLAWAYVQQKDYKSGEEIYRKALSLEPDKNKQCNLAICLMHMNKMTEARFLLRTIRLSAENGQMDESYANSYERAAQMMDEIESQSTLKPVAQEKEIGKEVQTPVTNRSLKGLSTSHGEDQNNAFGSVTSRSLSDGNMDRKLPLAKWSRGSCTWNFHDNRANSFYSDRGTSKGTSFCSRRDENWFSTGLMEEGSACKKAYTSTFPAGGTPRVPYTQPRRTSWSFKQGDQSRGWLAERAIGDCSRKLSFEQPTNNNNVQCVADRCPEMRSPFGNADNWGKKRLENCAKAYNEAFRGQSSTSNGEWKENSIEYDDKNNSAMQEYVLPSDSIVVGTNPGENEQSEGKFDQNPNFRTVENGGLKEIAENTLENLKSVQQLDANLKPTPGFSKHKCKKSWADMVDEEEQELQSGISNFADEGRASQYQDLFGSYRIPSPSSYAREDTEEFNDENTDSNILLGIPTLNQPNKVTERIETYYTQPGKAAPSMSRDVRRTLCFNKDQKPGRADSYCPSPLEKKALDFNSNASMLSDGCAYSSGVKLLRRNRLQVFREITPESPRP